MWQNLPLFPERASTIAGHVDTLFLFLIAITIFFTMLIATQLNFLHRQVKVALDPVALTRDRDWAALEIDESLRTLPPPGLLGRVLETLDGCG